MRLVTASIALLSHLNACGMHTESPGAAPTHPVALTRGPRLPADFPGLSSSGAGAVCDVNLVRGSFDAPAHCLGIGIRFYLRDGN